MDGPPPRPDRSVDFESVAVIAATPALLELLAPKPSEPAMAEVEVQAATFGFKVKAQTYPTGNRHVVCMCSQCEGARYGLEPGGSHVL